MKQGPLSPDDPQEVRTERWEYVHRRKGEGASLRTIGKELGISHVRVAELLAMSEPPGLPRWAGHSARNGADPPDPSSP